jgi:hypothetical protein
MSDAKSQAKVDRLKAALKDNLRRRKAQARGRKAVGQAEPGEAEAEASIKHRDD